MTNVDSLYSSDDIAVVSDVSRGTAGPVELAWRGDMVLVSME